MERNRIWHLVRDVSRICDKVKVDLSLETNWELWVNKWRNRRTKWNIGELNTREVRNRKMDRQSDRSQINQVYYIFPKSFYNNFVSTDKDIHLIVVNGIGTGCSLNIVFFRRFLYIFRTQFSLDVSVCTHTRQAEHQRCSRTGRVQKKHNI